MGRIARAVALVLLATLPATAPAEEEPSPEASRTRAMALFREGQALHARGDHDAARARFEEARDLFEALGEPATAAWMVSWIADGHLAAGRTREGLAARRDALRRMRTARGGEDHPDVGKLLERLGHTYWDLGRREEALEALREGLELFDRLGGRGHPVVETARSNLAAYLLEVGRHAEALPLFAAVLEAWRKRVHGDHPMVAATLANLAICHEGVREPGQALPLHEEALAMRRRLAGNADHATVAHSLNNLGHCMMTLRRPSDARGRFEEALVMRRRLAGGKDDPLVAQSLGNLGHALDALGRSGEALRHHEEALAIRRRLHGGGHETVAMSLQNLGACLEALGRFDDARERFEAALTIRERLHPAGHVTVARSLNRLARCLTALGRPAEALARVEEALRLYRELREGDHPDVARSLTLLGHGAVALGRPEDALPRFVEALAMRRRLHRGDHPDIAVSLVNLAQVLTSLGRTEEALPLDQEALAMERRLHGRRHPAVALCENNLGTALAELGKLDEAREHLEAAVALGRETRSPEAHLWLANLAGHLLEVEGRPADAVPLYAEAIGQIEGLRRGAAGLDERDRGTYFEHLKRFDAFDGMIRAQLALGNATEVLRTLERGRGRSLLDLLARSRFDALEEVRRRAAESEDRELLAAIDAIAERLAKSEREINRLTHAVGVARGREDLEAADRRALIDGLHEALERNHVARREALRDRARLVRDQLPLPWPADPAALQRLLGEGERLLAYTLTTRGGVAVLVPPAGEEIRAFPLDLTYEDAGKAVDGRVKDLVEQGRRVRGLGLDPRGPTRPSRAPPAANRAAHELFRKLFPEEVWKEIRSARVLYLVPHGPLHRLPFEALVTTPGREPRFWLDEGPPIAYASSGSALLWARERREQQLRRRPRAEAVLLGDPAFSRPAGEKEGPEPPERGVLLLEVGAGSPAAKAGLTPGDVLVAYDGTPLENDKALRRETYEAEVAWEDGDRDEDTVAVRYWRDGEEKETTLPVGKLGVLAARVPPREARRRVAEGSLDPRRHARERAAERYGRLEPLPGTRREILAIRESLEKRDEAEGAWRITTLLGDEATESRLFDAAPRSRFLHLATHQLADETNRASYSSLAFALPAVATERDDGFLKLIDLLEHWRDRLSRCELVVLSACETKRGRLQRDEGVFAMPWGFQYAGSPTVIASLWRVDDDSTATLMSDFYARLAEQERPRKLEAFTAARKALREKHPEPYFWAPFVYIGDPR
jgi:tetratricopeptide (TPR) repeat protein